MGAAKTKLSIKLPQAQDDTCSVLEGGMLTLDVLDNDKGGNSTSIYSIDQGDLSSETSDDVWIDLLGGGRIKIVDDKIIFDTDGDFERLAEGETTEVVFTYAMRLGNGAISQAEVTVEITGKDEDGGTNTDPVAAADVIIATVSTDAVIPVEWLLANDSDADPLDTLTVTSVSIVGLSTDWTLDTTDLLTLGTFTVSTPGAGAAVDPLVLSYGVDDGNGGTATGTATIGLAAPSTVDDDNLDISGSVYDFSFLEGKEGSDTILGGDSDDTIFGGNTDGSDSESAVNDLYGDAFTLGLNAGDIFNGGNDRIFGAADADNSLYGDSFRVNFNGDADFTGGNDVLTGGDGSLAFNDLYGDAQTVDFQGNAGTAQGGDDRLISGEGANDVMHGDFVQILEVVAGSIVIGGSDTFVFGTNNGTDRITDFEVGVDTIQLDGFGFTDFSDLAGLWTAQFNLPLFLPLALDLDGTVDGVGDIIIFNGLMLGDEASLAGDFVFT